jgi:hypothetical protein
MAVVFDPETLARFRTMKPLEVFREAKDSVYRAGASSSDDFLDIFEELVNQGVLSWDQVEEFDS